MVLILPLLANSSCLDHSRKGQEETSSWVQWSPSFPSAAAEAAPRGPLCLGPRCRTLNSNQVATQTSKSKKVIYSFLVVSWTILRLSSPGSSPPKFHLLEQEIGRPCEDCKTDGLDVGEGQNHVSMMFLQSLWGPVFGIRAEAIKETVYIFVRLMNALTYIWLWHQCAKKYLWTNIHTVWTYGEGKINFKSCSMNVMTKYSNIRPMLQP